MKVYQSMPKQTLAPIHTEKILKQLAPGLQKYDNGEKSRMKELATKTEYDQCSISTTSGEEHKALDARTKKVV